MYVLARPIEERCVWMDWSGFIMPIKFLTEQIGKPIQIESKATITSKGCWGK